MGTQEGQIRHKETGEAKLNAMHMRRGTVKIKQEVACTPSLR